MEDVLELHMPSIASLSLKEHFSIACALGKNALERFSSLKCKDIEREKRKLFKKGTLYYKLAKDIWTGDIRVDWLRIAEVGKVWVTIENIQGEEHCMEGQRVCVPVEPYVPYIPPGRTMTRAQFRKALYADANKLYVDGMRVMETPWILFKPEKVMPYVIPCVDTMRAYDPYCNEN